MDNDTYSRADPLFKMDRRQLYAIFKLLARGGK